MRYGSRERGASEPVRRSADSASLTHVSARARLLVALALGAMLVACSTITSMLPSQREARERAERMQELQQRVMRYADAYAGRVREVVSEYQAAAANAQDRLDGQEWKVQQSNAAYTIASGPSPIVNMLDMVVLATLSRMVIDDVWLTQKGRERGRPLRELHAALEVDAWRLADGVLDEEQEAELREAIARWRDKHPQVESVANIHFMDFAVAAGLTPANDRSPTNLFSLFGLDVFSGLDPAVREIAQTRALAERSIYYLQRAPTLLDLQVERLAYEFAITPEMKNLLSDAERISQVGAASDRLVTMLPELVATERAAAISQLLEELDARTRNLGAAAAEIRLALEAGTDTAQALQTTIASIDRLAVRHAQLKPARTDEPGRPFDVREYTALLREADETARELTELADRIERLLPQTANAARSATTSVGVLVDRVFLQALALIVATFVCALVAGIAYRAAASRIRAKHGV